ncbi:Hypothetical protein NTJ_05487 [Nesidiocoris tenuis]|uniref:Uncharacterized protein n=1 Tax=Nesidiocoris tenuis TaxID=355587 RepID=A0ABN7AL29_9HEMI|nr:Hypothetical protein NTJ_05487 [Nesidiocoris tenuis]
MGVFLEQIEGTSNARKVFQGFGREFPGYAASIHNAPHSNPCPTSGGSGGTGRAASAPRTCRPRAYLSCDWRPAPAGLFPLRAFPAQQLAYRAVFAKFCPLMKIIV